MSRLLRAALDAAREAECLRNDKLLAINYHPAQPVGGHSFDAVINAMTEESGRIEVAKMGVPLRCRCGFSALYDLIGTVTGNCFRCDADLDPLAESECSAAAVPPVPVVAAPREAAPVFEPQALRQMGAL